MIGSNARKFNYSLYFINCDITEYDNFARYVDQHRPDAIVHFAEQRAAPYSMKSKKERRYTVENNITGTHNVLNAIIDHSPNTHLVHLGTMQQFMDMLQRIWTQSLKVI